MNKVNQIKVKAIIRYNVLDGKEVAYIRRDGRFFKIIDSKTIRPMSKVYSSFRNLSYYWSKQIKVDVVNEDEQLLWDGRSLDIGMDTFTFNTKGLNVV